MRTIAIKFATALFLCLPANTVTAQSVAITYAPIINVYTIMHEWKFRGIDAMIDALAYFITKGTCRSMDAEMVLQHGSIFLTDILFGFPEHPLIEVTLVEDHHLYSIIATEQ